MPPEETADQQVAQASLAEDLPLEVMVCIHINSTVVLLLLFHFDPFWSTPLFYSSRRMFNIVGKWGHPPIIICSLVHSHMTQLGCMDAHSFM